MVDFSILPIGMWIGGGLVALAIVLFLIGLVTKTIRAIILIAGIVILLASLGIWYFKLPFF